MDTLNRECLCVGLDDAALTRALADAGAAVDLDALVRERCPHAFAARPVFLDDDILSRMAQVVRAVESIVALPAWQERVLAHAPAIARHEPPGSRGVFMGYDFHLDGRRLGLIEINTNAGGAMLNLVAARAQVACCRPVEPLLRLPHAIDAFERDIVAMFEREWQLARPSRPLRRIAIVDEAPPTQYLYPEFVLFQQLFRRHGIEAVIADPAELRFDGQSLRDAGGCVDLVYNRLTDFDLATPDASSIREAWLADAIVLTPHPRAHALYADKRNLALLSDESALREMGVAAELRDVLLEAVPRTRLVDRGDAQAWWARRRKLFFKPAAGFGSRAAYRGDKLTRRVWQDILDGAYVAQELVPPGERRIGGDGSPMLKYDLRNYAYGGEVQWVGARLFQGQTTNFRTPGGGFAPVYRHCAIDDAWAERWSRAEADAAGDGAQHRSSASPLRYSPSGNSIVVG